MSILLPRGSATRWSARERPARPLRHRPERGAGSRGPATAPRARRSRGDRPAAAAGCVLRYELVELPGLEGDRLLVGPRADRARPRRAARVRAAPAADDGGRRSQLLRADAGGGPARLQRAAASRIQMLLQGASRGHRGLAGIAVTAVAKPRLPVGR